MPDAAGEVSAFTPAGVYLGKAFILAEEIVKRLTSRGELIAAAESCTAGLASSFIARVPGASKVFWGSFVTYTADAKVKMLGVPEELIKENGAVSRSVALAMAEGAIKQSGATWAFSITGFAGPNTDTSDAAAADIPEESPIGAPIGTVWIGLAGRFGETASLFSASGPPPVLSFGSEAILFRFSGSRNEVREAAAAAALEEILERILPLSPL